MSRPINVEVHSDDPSIRSLEQMIRRFLRKCKDEGILREHLEQFHHETKGQKERRKRREGARRCKKKGKPARTDDK